MPRWLARLRIRLRALLSREHDREVSDELQLHVDLLAEEYHHQGLSEAEARSRANREFGNLTRLRETVHEVSSFPWLEGVLRDVGYACRELRRSKGVTIVAVLSLALGIGANTAIFSVVNALMLRALPVAEPERLVALSIGEHERSPVDGRRWSYGFWQAIEQRADAFDGAIAWSGARFDLSNGGEVDPVTGLFASGDFFRVLGVPALVGRTLTAEDDVRGSAQAGPIAMISHRMWQTRFGGSPDVVGTPLVIQGIPFTIVGVTDPHFTGLEVGQAFDVALPLAEEPLIRGSQSFINPPFDRMNYWLRIAFRLKPGQSVESAGALVRGLQPQLRDASVPPELPGFAEGYLKEPLTIVSAGTGMSLLRQTYRRPLVVLLAVVALVLLLACTNIASLLLARAMARGHELSVRLALGASRWRIARQLLIESLVLAASGAVAGLLVAAWASRALVAQLSTASTTVSLDLQLDWRVLAFTALTTMMTAVLCGVAPAFRTTGVAPIDVLKEQGRGIAGERRITLTGGLLVAQVALSLTLVVAAGLFVGTFARLTRVPLGFDSDRLLLVTANAGRASVAPAERSTLYDRLVDAAGAVPGVAITAASTSTPVSGTDMSLRVDVTDEARSPDVEVRAKYTFVTPGWFATYGVPIRTGRDVSLSDSGRAPPVAIVNSAFADRFFPGRPAIGESIGVSVGPRGEMPLGTRTIVGVVGNTVYRSLREETQPVMFFPIAQWNLPIPLSASVTLGIRPVGGAPASLSAGVTAALTAIEPRLGLTIRTLHDQVRESVHQERLIGLIAGLFGVLALLLAGLGLYGVTSYGVTRRRMEIGIRMALGATPPAVVRLVLSRVCVLVGIGVLIGAGLSIWLSQFVASLLYGVRPGDPLVIGGAALILLTVAASAAWLPTRRALGIVPAEILRES